MLERLFKPENSGKVKQEISALDKAIKDTPNCKTLGQYFWKLYQADRNNNENKIRTKYTAREEHYLKEFDLICSVQKIDSINEKYSIKNPSQRYSGLTLKLYKAIFYQRPLKSQKGLIGKCSLEPKRTRCSSSRPEFEEFRMYSFINTIKLKKSVEEKFRFLTQEEKKEIESRFYRKSKSTFAFEDVKKTLGKEYFYNYKDKTTVSGCPTIANLINVFGSNWKKAIFENYVDKTIINRKTKEIIGTKEEEDIIADVWHVLSSYTSDEKLKDFATNKLNADNKTAEKFSKIHLKKDYANLSLYAINKILPYLKSGLLYSHAVFMANMNNIVKEERWGNEEDKKLIESSIKEIIDNHQVENKINFVINSLLSNCFDNNYAYSKEAESVYKVDLEKLLEKEFGKERWNNEVSKIDILKDAFQNFTEHLKNRKRVSIKRIDEKVINFLSDNDLLKENAANKLYHPSDIEKFRPATIKAENKIEYKGLGSPITGSIKNPMALKTLHQLRKLINTLILDGEIDEQTKIHIELARELNDANKRKAIEKWQNDRKDLRDIYRKKIKELYKSDFEPTDTDIEKFGYAIEQREDGIIISKEEILKYQLWEEQKHICIYTGKTINLSSFLGEEPSFDFEHTIPRSLSWDNSQKNKTLCDSHYNRNIKKTKIPFELDEHSEILQRIEHWKEKFNKLHDEIERLKGASRNAADKEHKDRLIQKRHYLQMECDYWREKYYRFTMKEVKSGFKNSQYTDTGIITKYAVAYMKSIFNKVYSIKGEMVDQYRKSWGLHETYEDKRGVTHYLPKDRSNHIHHCIDAVTIACMNKGLYDKMAHAWGLEDKGDYNAAKKELAKSKPWETFTEDVKNLENEVLIVHRNKDVLPIQAKKKVRKSGVIQRNKKGEVIYQQGDGVRGSLHKENYIGIVEQPVTLNTKSKAFIEKTIEDKTKRFFYVKRSPITKDFSESDVNKIVDEGIKKRIEKNGLKNVKIKDGYILLPAEKNGENGNVKGLKEMLIKKIRLFEKDTPIEVKEQNKINLQSSKAKKNTHKHHFYAQNKENYCMAIYEGLDKKGNVKRDYELVNNIDAGEYYKLGNKKDRQEGNVELLPQKHIESGFRLLYQNDKPFILKKGVNVFLLKNNKEQVKWESQSWLKARLYIISGVDKDGIKLNYHQEARMGTDTMKYMNDVINLQKLKELEPIILKIESLDINDLRKNLKTSNNTPKEFFKKLQELINDYDKENNILNNEEKITIKKLKESGLTTPKGGDVIDKYKEFPYIKFKPNGFYVKLENIDFKITPTGKIIKV